MQSAGAGRRIAAPALQNALARSASLRKALLNYAHAFLLQTAQTAVANGKNLIHERLARWLCMAHDRVEDDEIVVIQEFLAKMLGVTRPGVTTALAKLESAGLVAVRRGRIDILNRPALERSTGGTYGLPERELQRLLG
jgi:CRP-like cAMP-binding protein